MGAWLKAVTKGRGVKGCRAGLGRDLREDYRGLEEGGGRSSCDLPSGSSKGPVEAIFNIFGIDSLSESLVKYLERLLSGGHHFRL